MVRPKHSPDATPQMRVIVESLRSVQDRFATWNDRGWQAAAAEWIGFPTSSQYNQIVNGRQKSVTLDTLLTIRRRLPATVLRALEFPVPDGVVDEVPEPPEQRVFPELEWALRMLGDDVAPGAESAAREVAARKGDRTRGEWIDFLSGKAGGKSAGKSPRGRSA